MRLMIIEKGSVNAAVFIAFQKRLIASAKRAIFRIVDRAPAHRAKKTAAFASTPGGNLRLFFLPPYAPDRNPDPLVGEHLEAAGRMALTGQDDFNRKVRSSMRHRQNDPEKIRSFARKLSLKYTAGMGSDLMD
jgi:hypothetical protein